MGTFNQILQSIFSFGADVCISFFVYGFIASMLALIWSIFFVRRFNQKGLFDRPNKIWGFIAGIHKYYLPVVFMLMFGCLAGIYGVNSKVNDTVEQTVHASIDMLNLTHISLEGLDEHMKGQVTLEEALVSELNKENDNHHVNSIITQSILQELGYPKQIDGYVEKIRSIDWTVFNKGLHYGVSYIATDYIDDVFWIAYRFIIVFFILGFLKLPLLELVCFFAYKTLFGYKPTKQNSVIIS